MTRSIVFYDTEYTTWPGAMDGGWTEPGQYRELVQIGAVRFDLDRLVELDEFQILIKPEKNPVLSDLFIELTGITNDDIARAALSFPDAYHTFCAFVQGDTMASYGGDSRIVRENLGWHAMPDSEEDFDCVNIRDWFQTAGAAYGVHSKTNSGKLAAIMGAEMLGIQEHNALHDARSIAAAYRFLVQKGIKSPV